MLPAGRVLASIHSSRPGRVGPLSGAANLARRIHRASLAVSLAALGASALAGMGESLRGAGRPPSIVYHDPPARARESLARGDFKGAARQFQVLCELGLDDLAACDAYADAMGKSGDAEAELLAYRRTVDRFPLRADAHISLALALARRGRGAEALSVLGAALRLRPDDVTALMLTGELFKGQGRLAEAAEAYARALRASPKNAGIHNQLGSVYGSAGRYHLAVEHFEAASRLDPGLAAARQNLQRAREALERSPR
jgi:tetratricopeptide (TPR) repeat protein